MIDYSLSLHRTNPSDKNSEKKVYATPQSRETLSLNQMARHIAEHGSAFSRDTIIGATTALVDCIREQLLAGNRVSLGELGTFYLTFSGEGVDNADDYNPQNQIKTINVRWDRGSAFENLKQDATFSLVSTRKQQQLAKKAEKEALNAELSGDEPQNPGGDVTE